MRTEGARAGAEENGAPAGVDGLELDAFGGQGGAVADIELAAAPGFADMDPFGGSMAGAAESSRVTEGPRQHGKPPVAVVPVPRRTQGSRGGRMRRRSGEANPGRDSRTPRIGDSAAAARFRFHTPAGGGPR